jgi:hypothetical protein
VGGGFVVVVIAEAVELKVGRAMTKGFDPAEDEDCRVEDEVDGGRNGGRVEDEDEIDDMDEANGEGEVEEEEGEEVEVRTPEVEEPRKDEDEDEEDPGLGGRGGG